MTPRSPTPPPDRSALAARLAAFPGVVRAACAGLAPADERFRAVPTDWSILEVVVHLADEEDEDFPVRLASTLTDPGAAWSPIDPGGWAIERAYRDQDLAEQLDRFAARRTERVAWLRSLDAPDWLAAHAHPSIGPLRAGDLLASWCADDALHLRQIARRLFELARRDAAGFDVGYAGSW